MRIGGAVAAATDAPGVGVITGGKNDAVGLAAGARLGGGVGLVARTPRLQAASNRSDAAIEVHRT